MTAKQNSAPDVFLDPAWIAPHRTALCLIDLQADFASPEGQMALWGADLSAVPQALENSRKLLEGARSSGVHVMFVKLETRPETDSRTWKEWMRRRSGDAAAENALCRADTPGVAFYGVSPAPGEHVVSKTKYSAFYGTDLEQALRRRGVDTLVVSGLTTECCVDATVRDAFHRDFYCVVAGDASAAYEAAFHENSLSVLEENCALVVSTEAIIEGWCEASRRAAGIIGRRG